MNELVESQNIEIKLLLDAIYLKYGYDFRHYAKASIKRRILKILSLSGIETISAIQNKILNDKIFFEKFLLDISVHVTEMFRDSSFYQAIREKVLPLLKNMPFIKIWHAGCSTGEEVYSMAILLKEEKLYEKVRIYATDYNNNLIKIAKSGIYQVDKIKNYAYNYQKSGGTLSFEEYYNSNYTFAIIKHDLKDNILFAEHNLATDNVFGEMNMIICRNVLIYFDKFLQNRVLGLFNDSLCVGGFLCLGSKESLLFSNFFSNFNEFIGKEKIYIKK